MIKDVDRKDLKAGTATVSRRTKGEQTRSNILEAALRLIATQGHKAVTHRSVAAEAQVNLSLTTYYFKDLKALKAEAFAQYRHQVERDVEETWESVFQYLDGVVADSPSERLALRDQLAGMATEYVMNQVTNRPNGLLIEMAFFYDLNLDPALRQSAAELRSRFEAGFTRLCQTLGSDQPQTDAALLLGTLQRLEYMGLAAEDALEPEAMLAQFTRMIGWIMKVGS